MVEIIPAVLVGSLEEMRAKLARVRGVAGTVQIDLCDGFFVPTRTWPFNTSDKKSFDDMARGVTGLPYWEDFDFEIDLMVQSPEKVLPHWIKAGIARAVFHLESRHDVGELRRAADGIELGVALNIATPLARLDPYLDQVDYVQFMGIATIGKQGEPFDERVLETIRTFKSVHPDVVIQVDGAVDAVSAPQLIAAGATRLVSGSYIMNSDDPREAIASLDASH